MTFQSVHIAENWRLDGALFTNASAFVKFEEVKVGAATTLIEARFAGYISFKDARFAALDVSKVAWPASRDDHPWLWLNGMTCDRISAESWTRSGSRNHGGACADWAGIEFVGGRSPAGAWANAPGANRNSSPANRTT